VLAAALQIFFWHSPERHAGFKLWLSSGRSAVRNSRVMSRLHEEFVWNSSQRNERLAIALFIAGAVIVVVLVVVVRQ
jgi:hypothetical protein